MTYIYITYWLPVIIPVTLLSVFLIYARRTWVQAIGLCIVIIGTAMMLSALVLYKDKPTYYAQKYDHVKFNERPAVVLACPVNDESSACEARWLRYRADSAEAAGEYHEHVEGLRTIK